MNSVTAEGRPLRADAPDPAHGAVLVTGAARGIGAAIVERVVAGGGLVVAADLDGERAVELAARVSSRGPGRAVAARVDVTREDQVREAVEHAADLGGGLAAVFANAGAVGVTGRLEDTGLEQWRATLDLLLTGTVLTAKHAVRLMRPRRRGAVVCTGSVASVRGGLGPHAYTAAKQGVRGLVESLAVEVAPDGLTVNAVAPGGTVSSLSAGLMSGDPDDLDTPRRRLAAASSSGEPTTAADVAAAACFLASPAARRINGACLVVDGGDDVLGAKGRAYYS